MTARLFFDALIRAAVEVLRRHASVRASAATESHYYQSLKNKARMITRRALDPVSYDEHLDRKYDLWKPTRE